MQPEHTHTVVLLSDLGYLLLKNRWIAIIYYDHLTYASRRLMQCRLNGGGQELDFLKNGYDNADHPD